ncbi:MAG: hypothetical protein ACE5F1_15410 [Planctomycetota bacterium]
MLLTVMLVLGLAPSAPAQDGQWTEFQLQSGIRVSVLEVEDAPKQSTFTFLPLGLTSDGPEKAQFSHLVEHMLIRSTDPESLEVRGIRMNGETTGNALRLETIADPEEWKAALGRHAKWLQARSFDAKTLEREKGRIQQEEQSTASAGYTHKWALAAWNQVARHQRSHAGLHADVAGASIQELEDYVGKRLRLDRSVRIFTVGPRQAREIRKVLEAGFGKAGKSVPEAEPTSRPVKLDEKKSNRATWDLPVAHYLHWYRVPSKTANERLAADLLARLVTVRLYRETELGKLGVRAMASVERLPGLGTFLLVSASLGTEASDARVAAVERILAEVVDQALEARGDVPSVSLMIRQLGFQAKVAPDFRALRKSLGGRRGADLVEANVAMQTAYREIALQLPRSEIGAAWAALDEQQVRRVHAGFLGPEQRFSLLLTEMK